MILPNKYVSLSESIIGISAIILDILGSKECHIDELWKQFKKTIKEKNLKVTPSYHKFVLTINFMYLTKMIDYNKNGVIYNENK